MSNLTNSPPVKDTNNNLAQNNNSSLFKFTNLLGAPDPDLDYSSLISEAKPAAILVNECGDVEIQMNQNHSYFYAYELVFQSDHNSVSNKFINDNDRTDTMNTNLNLDKLCCFAETKDGNLLLATEKGVVGIINLNKCMTAWISIIRTNSNDTFSTSFKLNDDLYESGLKKLVDLCLDYTNDQIVILTRYTVNDKYEYKIELYLFDEKQNEMCLIRILNLSQSLAINSNTTSLYQPDFVRIYMDDAENAYVLIDSNNHKVYWFNTSNCQAKRCVKSPDGESILNPSGLALLSNPKVIYICSKKGMLICRPDQHSVKHDSIKPIDISYSSQDHSLYFIDEFALYRSKLTDQVSNEQRFKRIFSTKKHESKDKACFRRVIVCQKHIFLMSNNINSLFVIEREHLKFR